MERKIKHLLDLDDYCLLEIMKYIIADCELREEPPDHPSKYENIQNFAKAYEYIEGLLKTYFKSIYYRRELTLVTKLRYLSIDFAQLQSVIEKKKEGDAYWKLYTNAILDNKAIQKIQLRYDPASGYPDFPKHFQMMKCALANKERLSMVKLALNGYSLNDLPIWGHVTELYLDVSMSAEALASACQSHPELCKLEFMSSEIQGRLSEIVPHCRNLQYLKFVPKPGVDGAEYAQLAELPKLREITIHGAYKNGSLLTMFKAIQKWQRSATFSINFSDELPSWSKVTIPRMNSLKKLEASSKKFPPRIELSATYDFSEISKDTSPLEQSVAEITLMATSLEMDLQGRLVTLWEWPTSDIDISAFASLLKLFHINGMQIQAKEPGQVHNPVFSSKAKLFASLISDELFGLKSIQSVQGQLDKLDTLELVKIKSLKLLKCSLSDWESLELLSELTNLTTLSIDVKKEFETTYSKALCKLLNTCQVSGIITCKSWRIEFLKNKRLSGKVNGVRTLTCFAWKSKFLNELFEVFAHRDFITIEEVRLERTDFKHIVKITKVQSIKKLDIYLKDTNGIEQLSKMNQIEELTIMHNAKGTLVKLFDQLAMKESPSLQSLQFRSNTLSPEELFKVSKIKSLKKLELVGPFFYTDYAALNELANSNIEELVVAKPQISLQKLLAAFALKTSTRLQHLKIVKRTLDLEEFEELSKLKGLRSFNTSVLNSENLPFLGKLENLESLHVQVLSVGSEFHLAALKKLVIHLPINLEKCKCLAKFENLESLTLSLLSYDWNHDSNPSQALANIKNLKELNIETTDGSQYRVYQALAHKKELKLRYLSAPIEFAEELNNIMRIKSLRTLHLRFTARNEINSNLDQLEELKELHIQIACYGLMSENQFDAVLSILKSCRNLESVFIKYTYLKHAECVGDIHNLLKSIRDPGRQRPLSLTVEEAFKNTEYYSHIVHLNFIDDDYLKVYYTNV